MVSHIHLIGRPACSRFVSFLLLVWLLALTPCYAQKGKKGWGTRNLKAAVVAAGVVGEVQNLADKLNLKGNKQKTGKRPVAKGQRPDIHISGKEGLIVDDLYYDDPSGATANSIRQLLSKYPEEDFHEGDQGQLISVEYVNCGALLPGNGHKLKFSFWHDLQKRHPCWFYEYTDKFDRNGNNITYQEPVGNADVVKEELQHSRRVNMITRKRTGSGPFHVFVPSYIYNFADSDYSNPNDQKEDIIYMYAELYDSNDKLLLNGTSYVYWKREPQVFVNNACTHDEEDICEEEISRIKIADGLCLVKLNRVRVCRKCGRRLVEDSVERTVECYDDEQPPKPEPDPEPNNTGDEEKREPCKHDFVFVRTENLGAHPTAKYYHKAEFVDIYKCRLCGMQKETLRSKNCQHRNLPHDPLCQVASPWVVRFEGVPLKMHLVTFDEDTTAVYVAETETTRQLWNVVCPSTNHGWHNGSQYPVTNVTAEEVEDFISNLNVMAAKEGVPLKFRLPTVEEWKNTSCQRGNAEGWIGGEKRELHEVAKKKADDLGLYDMLGNVSELCSDTITTDYKDGTRRFSHAVAGHNYSDGTNVHLSDGRRWADMSQGYDIVGFRLFADPVDGDDTKLEKLVETNVGANEKRLGNIWLVRQTFQCVDCGFISYGRKHHSRAGFGKKPYGCR